MKNTHIGHRGSGGGRGFGRGGGGRQGFIYDGYPYGYSPVINIMDPLYSDDDELGEEARELARSCGAEESALMRRTMTGIPHTDYRVLVVTAAHRLSPNPTTKHYAKAKTAVDAALVARGLGVVIPDARPGRVTR
jgi:hypothetical protein